MRRALFAFLAVLVACFTVVLVGCFPTGTTADIHTDINNYRAQVGSPPVRWSVNLASYAQSWADHMAATGSLTHSDINQLLVEYPSLTTCGEVILVGPDSITPQQIVDAWVASPSHQAILRSAAFTLEGNASAVARDGRLWVAAEFCG